IRDGFQGVEIVDITEDFVSLRYDKSDWEREQIRAAFALADRSYDAMRAAIKPGSMEIEVAAAGEYAARRRGATGCGFHAIVGPGARSNAVVPTATTKRLEAGETVMIGIAPKVNGYAGVVGHTLPVSGEYTASQKQCLEHLKEVFRLTKAQLVVGRKGSEID